MKIIVVSFPKVKRPHADAQYYGTLTDVVKNSSNRFSFFTFAFERQPVD